MIKSFRSKETERFHARQPVRQFRAFERVAQIEKEESRILVHPFEGHHTALGSATLGLEFCTQVADLDAVIVPIGGGGLCAAHGESPLSMQSLLSALRQLGKRAKCKQLAGGEAAVSNLGTLVDAYVPVTRTT